MIHDFEAALRVFVNPGVEFILGGGVSALARGVPVNTLDIDLVHARDSHNISLLLPVLESVDAVFRIQPDRRLRPNESHLSGRGHINLVTTLGPLDLRCTIGNELTYEDLLPDTDPLELGEGLTVRVLKLEKLIEIKEGLNTEKDRAMLPLLRRTLAEIRKAGG